jgi:tetratricopeptide (TPR) repeat protein
MMSIYKIPFKKWMWNLLLIFCLDSDGLHAQNPESSIEYLTRSITVDPKDTDAYFSRGYAYLIHGEYSKAVFDFTRCIQLSPEDALSYYFRGKAKVFLENNRSCIEDFTKALQINPNYVDALLQRAQARKRVQELSSAEEDLTQVIRLNPNLATAYQFRGLLKNEKRDAIGALKDFKKATELDPFASQSFEAMAWIYLASEDKSLRNLELAKKCAEEAYQLEKKEEYQHLLACIFSEQGDFENAERLETALILQNEDPLLPEDSALLSELPLLPEGSTLLSELPYRQCLENFRKKISYTQFLQIEQQKIDAEKRRKFRDQERRNRIWEEIVNKNEKLRPKKKDG